MRSVEDSRVGERQQLHHERLTKQVIEAFYDVYNTLGPGFLESVYQTSMVYELARRDIEATREHPLAVVFKGAVVGEYRADILVQQLIIVECKAVTKLAPAHEAQLLHYLKATRLRVGLLLNFGPRPTFKRRVV
jgi:GxxExxY protein